LKIIDFSTAKAVAEAKSKVYEKAQKQFEEGNKVIELCLN
jgi:hypothetical protein